MKKRTLLALLFTGLSITQGEDGLYTETYVVPTDFLQRIERTAPAPENSTYRKALEGAGIEFPEGATVQFDPANQRLQIHAGEMQQKRIQEILQGMAPKEPRFVAVQFEELPAEEEKLAKLELEWWDPDATPAGLRRSPKVRLLNSETSLVEEFRKKPVETGGANPIVSTGIVGVFTQPQFEILRKKINEGGMAFRTAPLATAESGRAVIVQDGNARWGVAPSVGSDDFTIDLSLYFPPHGEALFAPGDASEPSASVTLWDNQTIAWAEKRKNGDIRIVFATARVVNYAGTPLDQVVEQSP